jgi:hypothetical protein
MNRVNIPNAHNWPVNSSRVLIPTVVVRGFFRPYMRGVSSLIVTFAFWNWRAAYEFSRRHP